jgi:hypothetical protein
MLVNLLRRSVQTLLLTSVVGCVPTTETPTTETPTTETESERSTISPPSFHSFLESDPSDWATKSREELLSLYRDTYHSAWSGAAMLHLWPGHYVLSDEAEGSKDRRKRAFHLSVYDRESRIPLLVYSPGDPAPARHEEAADLQRVGATLFEVLEVPPPDGVTATPLAVPLSGKPKVIVVLVYDALSWAHWDRYLAKQPHHARLRAASQEYVNTRIGHMSSSTTVSHAVLATGQPPSRTGIPINHTRTGPGTFTEVFIDNRPERLLVPTVADLYDAMHDNRPIVASFCSQSRAAIAMAGHGMAHPGGDADIVVWQADHHGELETNSEFWSLPTYLGDLGPEAVMARHPDATLWETPITTNRLLFHSPHTIEVGEDVVTRLLDRAPFGEDDLTDLLFINQKVLDNIAHRMSADRPPYRSGMDALDAYLGRFLAQLDARFGEDYLLILTSDHGFGPPLGDPRKGLDSRRHQLSRVRTLVESALGVDDVVQDIQYLNVYIDEPKLAAAGKSLDDLCAAFSGLPWVEQCLTRPEVLGSPDPQVGRRTPFPGDPPEAGSARPRSAAVP